MARGLCYFYCPQENAMGEELNRSYADSGRLYCRYDVEGVDDKAFCMYNRVRFSCGKPRLFEALTFHSDFPRTPANCCQVLPLHNVTSRRYSIVLVQRLANKK